MAREPVVLSVAPQDGGQVLSIDDAIVVTFSDLEPWAGKNDIRRLRLYLAGQPLATVPRRGPRENQLVFDITWTEDFVASGQRSRALGSVLGRPRIAPRPAFVHVGEVGKSPFKAAGNEAPVALIQLLKGPRVAVFVLLVGLCFAGVFALAKNSDLLRDSTPSPAQGRKPYSLAKTQMAIWFLAVIVAFTFIWVTTGTAEAPSGSVLSLIGISAGTALSAAYVDKNKQTTARSDERSLDTQRLALEAEIKALTASIDAASAEQMGGLPNAEQVNNARAERAKANERHAQLSAELQGRGQLAIPPASMGFWTDVLSDESGVAFHRFQILAWCAVLVVIFAVEVYVDLRMPQFPGELLALLGISAGTYLGFKVPE